LLVERFGRGQIAEKPRGHRSFEARLGALLKIAAVHLRRPADEGERDDQQQHATEGEGTGV
jgi:hypothetical protein